MDKQPCCAENTLTGKGLSSTGVNIMSSMETSDADPLSGFTKPGYNLCSFVKNFMAAGAGDVPVVKTSLDKDDLFSSFYVRLGIHRHRYPVSPGLYAVGNPDKNSEVLVTANFKLTFDHLRKELKTVNAWILVLDTKGVNVWCAAGKGTFGTRELVHRIKVVSLEKVVDHRRLILPQLGATGVSAGEVKKLSGFRVIYGPIRAKDIPEFLKNGRKADKQMRQVTFTMYERFILTPVEVQIVLKHALLAMLILFVLSGIGPGIFSFSEAWERGFLSVFAMAAGIISGAVITPVMLPYIPVRSFALKGIITGSIAILPVLAASAGTISNFSAYPALFLFSVTISSFLAMNFTGTTPFTSASGVEKEMKRYIPVQFGALVLSAGLWIYSAF